RYWAGLVLLSGRAAALLVPSRLLSSEIVLVICLGDSESTGQGELGDVVLVERADVLVVVHLRLRLGLRDGEVVGDSGAKALLGLAERFVGEIQVGVGGLDQLGGGLNVKEAVVDVGVDLLGLVGEPRFGLLILGEGYLLQSAGLGDLQDGDADLTGGGVGAVGVAGGSTDVAEVATEADGRILAGDGGLALGAGGLDGLGGGLEVRAGFEGLREGCGWVGRIERG